MIERIFDYDLRTSVCWNCPTPVTGQDGGEVECPKCGQPIPLPSRATFLPAPKLRRPEQQDPGLRSQENRPLTIPDNIAFLWEDGDWVPSHRLDEAFVAWQGTRRRSGNDLGAAEEIVALTNQLVTAANHEGDSLRARALAESALEVVTTPRHRAQLLGMLVRMTVRGGRVQDAGRWLIHFEPSGDLEADSQWRFSTAVVATAYRQYALVVETLGSSFSMVAIQDALSLQAAVFRANALAHLGRREEAKTELRRFFDAGPAARDALKQIRNRYSALSLCEAVFDEEEKANKAKVGASVGTGKITIGCLLMGVALLNLLFDPPDNVVVSVACTLALTFWGIRTLRRGLRERRIFARGVRATARVLSVEPTGSEVNEVPEMAIDLEVALNPPVRSVVRKLLSAGEMHAYEPGTTVYVWIDPREPDVSVLEE